MSRLSYTEKKKTTISHPGQPNSKKIAPVLGIRAANPASRHPHLVHAYPAVLVVAPSPSSPNHVKMSNRKSLLAAQETQHVAATSNQLQDVIASKRRSAKPLHAAGHWDGRNRDAGGEDTAVCPRAHLFPSPRRLATIDNALSRVGSYICHLAQTQISCKKSIKCLRMRHCCLSVSVPVI